MTAEDAGAAPARFAVLARDLVRAGIAGVVAGVVIAGIGGRLVMRLATIAVPPATGQLTENGNRVGDITLGGSLGLIVFVGLLFGAFGAIFWAVVSPWIPGRGLRRGLLAMPVAVALGGIGLIQGDNRDFRVLEHSPVVVAMLVGLVAAIGLVLALLDEWLDGRLPPPGTEKRGLAFAYAILIAGGLLLLPLVLGAFFGGRSGVAVGLALVATGLATVAWWVLRFRGLARPPGRLVMVGRASLLAAVVLGTAALLPEIAEALGAR